ncbi:zinc ABC transporter solute-binding protein [Rhodococcus triatomae]|nr:zinc ABC transporter substrate-binding protein [Rhodococcus triatomae]QNG21104.1 zinc ABC transporter solute-binding protein [Rhodococcus triatomae]QNG25604.1 zinc ABC transporter solute-binding protein [Rhodococcus triatomae]
MAGAAGLSLAAALALTACGTSPDSDELTVVASTNVWGSVAQAVAGDHLEVSSIIAEPSADPHSFEASPSDAARITSASLLVYNGGGYDQFVDDIIADDSGRATVSAFELFEATHGTTDDHDHDHDADHDEGGHDDHAGHDHGSVNEHVWYDLPTVDATAHAVADELARLDPDNADSYRANADTFSAQLADVSTVVDGIASAHGGDPVAQTEPVAQYLLDAAQLRDLTPPDFVSAIENETDPAPAAIAATRALLAENQVRVLVYNVQTQDRVTQDIRSTAETAGIPVVEITETLPEGLDYIQWQTRTVDALASALE